MVSVVGALSAYYDENHGLNYSCPEARDLAGVRVVGKMCTLAAMAYKTAHGQPIAYPRRSQPRREFHAHDVRASNQTV